MPARIQGMLHVASLRQPRVATRVPPQAFSAAGHLCVDSYPGHNHLTPH